MASSEEHAVIMRQVTKHYGFRKNKVAVLSQVDLDVPKGCIFGLLGPSGCGKTTLLNCIIGRIQITNGTIRVFGKQPGSSKSDIPGSGVGYMPQELALYGELTAKETLAYFGRIHKLSSDKIKERSEFLLDFLNIPKKWRLIRNLSGGQQRRVSFAIALIHEPPLLILDEPTVGVDPLLRFNIWKHLIEMSSTGNITTIITTHYIEEANRANKVSLMREGRVLLTDDPQALLNRFQFPTLEDVFLHLCQKESVVEKNVVVCYSAKEKRDGDSHKCQILDQKLYESEIAYHIPIHDKKALCQCNINIPTWNHISALTIKNFITMGRKWPALIFQFLVPSLQIILVCLAISDNPHNLTVAVANEDTYLGKQFLSHIDNKTIIQVNVKTLSAAEQMVINGEAWGLIHIWRNFTSASANRFLKKANVSSSTIRSSNIHMRLDATNLLITYTLQLTVAKALQKFSESMDGVYGYDAKLTSLPIEFGEPIYGADNHNLTEYVIPGALVVIAFFVAFGLTSMEFVLEKREGLLDRTYVAGISSFEVMCGHILSQMLIMVLQVGLVLFVLIVIFKFPCLGNFIWVVLMILLQGVCGMACGYFFSTLLQEELAIMAVGLGYLFSTVIASGVLWPLEAMPDFMVKIGQILPQTYGSEALRCILSRGWGMTHIEVWRAYIVVLIWILVYMIFSLIALRVKR